MSNVRAAWEKKRGKKKRKEKKERERKHETPDGKFWKQALPWKRSGYYILLGYR